MEVWEERYCDEKWGLETPASFRYFTRYLQQPYPRSIEALCRQVNSEQKSQQKSQTKLRTFYDYSRKWKWIRRAEAYDEHLKQLHFKTKEKQVMEWETQQLKQAKKRAEIHTNTLKQIHQAEEDIFPLTKKAYAEETNERAYNEAIDAVYKLLHGGIIKQENRNTNKDTMNIKQDTRITEHRTIEEKNKENDEYFKKLEQDMGTE